MPVSVIIPTYNRLPLLIQTLENVLAQSIQPLEIIVVDNGSTDGTSYYLTKNYFNRILFVENNGEKTPGAARNLGFSISKGDYIQFFDSDDVMTRNKLEDQYSKLSASNRGFIYGPYIHASQDEQGNWKQKDVVIQYYPLPRNDFHYYMAHGFFTVIPGCLFKRELLEAAGPWREDVYAYEDWDYLWRLVHIESQPLHTNESAMFYRVHEQQLTRQQLSNPDRDKDKVKVLSDIIKTEEQSGLISPLKSSLLNAQLYKTLTYINNQPEFAEQYKKADTLKNKLFLQYLRLTNKLGRLRTHSAWQPFHGINTNPKMFERYFRLIIL